MACDTSSAPHGIMCTLKNKRGKKSVFRHPPLANYNRMRVERNSKVACTLGGKQKSGFFVVVTNSG